MKVLVREPRAEARTLPRRLALFVALSTALLLQGCTESIVENGHGLAAIVVAKGAPIEVSRAAKELQSYVRKTSGAELPIRVEGSADNARVEIRLAVTPLPLNRSGDPTKEIVHEDGYAITSSGRTITILGGSPRGALYGVYDFVERVLGVRWFMPTPMGEDILEAKTIKVPELSIVKNPAFPAVSGFTWAGSPGAEEWELRMRVKVGADTFFGHNWSNIYPLTQESFPKDPEMFALFNGRRAGSTQLCSSNPKVVQVSVEAARRYFQKNPNSPLFSISPNDGTGFCECDRCRKVDALYGVTDGTVSDRLVHYANEVLRELEKTNPGKRVGIYAYVQHTPPPKRAKPMADYETALTHVPWEFCHVHSIDDPTCPANRRWLEYLKGWAAVTKHTGVYEYYGHFFAFTPWPIVHSLRKDIPLFKRLGIQRFISETQQNWSNQGINFYVAAKLIEDPSRDVDALLDEYFARFYGKAQQPMRAYFDLWENAMQRTGPAGDHGYVWMSMFTPTLIAEAGTLLKNAETIAQNDTEQIRSRVAFACLGFDYTEAFTTMMDAGARKDVRGVLAASERAQSLIKKTEGSAPQAFFVSLALQQTQTMANIALSGELPWVALAPVVEPTPRPKPSPTTP